MAAGLWGISHFQCPLQKLNLPVVGSQLVGLIPKKAMLDAAEFYIKKEKLFILEEEQKIRLVMWLLLLPAQGSDHERDTSHPPPASQSGAEQRFGSAQAPGMTLVSRVDFGG